jgi:ribosomal protein L13E
MKKLLLFFALSFVMWPLIGQSNGEVQEYSKGLSFSNIEESEDLMSAGFRNSFSIRLPSGDKRLVARVWKDYVSTHFDGRTKYDRKAKEYVTANAKIGPISPSQTLLIGKPEKMGDATHFTIWLDNDGEQVSSRSNRSHAREAYSILEDFALEIEREKVRLHLEGEQKNLRKMETQLRRLENANTRYYREIEMAKARILKMEENIVQNEADQIKAQEEINQQHELVKGVKDSLDRIN